MSLLISSVFTYDEDAGNYIQAVETADAQALEPATRKAINNFVIGCKQDGIWTAIKASCILSGARTLAGALVPLVGTAPTNAGPFVSGDYNRETGLLGDGSTKYLNSNLAASALPLNSHHLAVNVTEANTSNNRIFIGAGGFSPGCEIGSYFLPPNVFGSRSNTASPDLTAPGGSGNLATFYGISRENSANYTRRHSSTNATISNASTGLSSGNYAIFARSTPQSHTNARLAFYSIGESLDLALLDARVTDLINAFAAAIP